MTTRCLTVPFFNWGEVQDYVEWDPDGRDLRPFVDVIDVHGVDVFLRDLAQFSSETSVEVTVSTTHSAKCHEWSSVRVAGDFLESANSEQSDRASNPLPGKVEPERARLAYVAVTRPRHQADLGALAWINQHPDGNPPANRDR